jgi:hypothetical protein
MATYNLISSVSVGSGTASSIDFTSIPSTYTDLIVRMSTRAVATSNFPNTRVRFNSDTGSNYVYRRLYGTGVAAGSDTATETGAMIGNTNGSDSTTNVFAITEFYIPNYAGSNQKTLVSQTASENNGATAYIFLMANRWNNTSAITSMSIYSDYNFAQYSTAYLYGISNA